MDSFFAIIVSMTKKIIAIDLDGTLLRSDHTISDYTVETLQKIQEKGHKIIISTGRPYRTALPYYHQLGLHTPMINFNGSLTHIPESKWAYEHSVTIDRQYLLELLGQAKQIEADFIASEYRKKFYITTDFPETIEPQLFGVPEITEKMVLKTDKITKNPNAILFQTRADDKYALAEELRQHFSQEMEVDSWGGPLNILECSPKGINKAYALKYLLEILNIDKDRLIAFGDEHNDTEMLALAKTGYAMKNANPMLLDFADDQISWTNNEDGVARKLEELFL